MATADSPELGSRSSGSWSGRSTAVYSGWVYHVDVNFFGQKDTHLRFLVISGHNVAMYKRDPYENPGLKPIRKGIVSHTLVLEELGRRKVNEDFFYVVRLHNQLDQTKKEEIACGTLREARKWIVAFEQAKEQIYHPVLASERSLQPYSVERSMSFQLLEELTDGFSEERILGNGAFGKVYKGVNKDGEKIAVKMLYDMPGIDDQQFQNEFSNLARLQHQNIVRLVSHCYEIQNKCVEHNGRLVVAEKTIRALCLEYMLNGSLDQYLSDEFHGLDWNTRYSIIKGICKGLQYLHEELECPIYHLDLKPGNILLDDNMVPRIADFGMARLFGEERTRITKSCIGTRGYIPPEYIERNVISNKFDIFSLGVVIIKIMTGPTGYYKTADMSRTQFIELVHENWRKRLTSGEMYGFPEFYCIQVKKCIRIALSCVEPDRSKRPLIGEVIDMLNSIETDSKHVDKCNIM